MRAGVSSERETRAQPMPWACRKEAMSAEDLMEMPFLRNVGLVMTYRCQVSCPHCIIEAGPHRTEEMSSEEACGWIRQIADYRGGYIKVLSLTGGEPFFNIASLKRISTFGEACGLLVSAVTNAYWAASEDRAVEILRGLPSIKMLAISADAYHQMAIPLERVRHAVTAAKRCGIPYNIAVCTEDEQDAAHRDLIAKLGEFTEPETVNTAVTFPAGRALKRIGMARYRLVDEPPASACSAGSSPIVFPDGRVIACIGPVIDLSSPHPLVLGKLRTQSLAEVLDEAERNPILHAIRVWGPHKIVSLSREAGLGAYLPKKYIKESICNVCYGLMSSPDVVGWLNRLGKDAEFRRKVAYARLYYLRESRMLEDIHDNGAPA